MGKLGLGCLVLVVALVVIVGMTVASTNNRLVTLGQDVDKNWAEVENQYQRRADLVPNLVATVQGAANFEKETLTRVTEARASVGRATITPGKAPTDPEALARYQAAQDQLGSALQRLLVVSENYPELKANNNFMQLQKRISELEEKIADRREFFNDDVNTYNIRIQQLPDVFIAGFMHLQHRDLFKVTEEDRQDVDVKMT